MMKKVIAASMLAIFAASAAPVQAADANQGVYLRLDSGWSFSRDAGNDLGDDVGGTPIIGAGVGYRLNQYLRADATVAYRGGYEIDQTSSNINWDGDVSAVTGMLNVYADVAKFGRFTPYVGGGVGFSRNTVDDVAVSSGAITGTLKGDTNTSFAWQLSTGVGIEIAPKWSIDVGYRYMDMGEAKSGTSATVAGIGLTGAASEGDLHAHEIQAGVRYQF